MKKFNKIINNLSNFKKRAIISFFDSFLILASIYISLVLRYESTNIYFSNNIYLFIIGFLLFFLLSYLIKINLQTIRFFNLSNIIFLSKVVFFFTLIFFCITFFLNFPNSPRSIPLFVGPIFFLLFIISRLFIRFLVLENRNKNSKLPILIYGAGSTGIYFFEQFYNKYQIIGFIDDDPTKWGRIINSLKVYAYNDLKKIIYKRKIKEIIIAIPNLNFNSRKIFQQKLNDYSIKINFTKMDYDQNLGINKPNIDSIRLYDLIDRDLKVDYKLNNKFKDKVIFISGAGGSIGSELSRQLLMSDPKILYLVDMNELNLFNLSKQLDAIKNQYEIKTILYFKLINLIDVFHITSFFESINKENLKIDYIFHCAAYKHVDLVENNKIYSLKNNMLSTINLVKLAEKYHTKKFVLISSDKAVRPKSLMGKSKLLAEQYVLKFGKINKFTNFTIVRFGNVLGSSGSVIPIFNNQIKNGGPITVTDPNVTRFFMTIEEASYLVLQSSIISKKSEVFLINMGNPIKVIDIARRLLSLHGLVEKNEKNLNGIEIKITGLKKGEKLHEELLIDKDSLKTSNKNLLIASEKEIINLKIQDFENVLNELFKTNSENIFMKKLDELI